MLRLRQTQKTCQSKEGGSCKDPSISTPLYVIAPLSLMVGEVWWFEIKMIIFSISSYVETSVQSLFRLSREMESGFESATYVATYSNSTWQMELSELFFVTLNCCASWNIFICWSFYLLHSWLGELYQMIFKMTKNDQVDHRYIPSTNFQPKSHPYVVWSRELVGRLAALITPTGWKKLERRELAHKNA